MRNHPDFLFSSPPCHTNSLDEIDIDSNIATNVFLKKEQKTDKLYTQNLLPAFSVHDITHKLGALYHNLIHYDKILMLFYLPLLKHLQHLSTAVFILFFNSNTIIHLNIKKRIDFVTSKFL